MYQCDYNANDSSHCENMHAESVNNSRSVSLLPFYDVWRKLWRKHVMWNFCEVYELKGI